MIDDVGDRLCARRWRLKNLFACACLPWFVLVLLASCGSDKGGIIPITLPVASQLALFGLARTCVPDLGPAHLRRSGQGYGMVTSVESLSRDRDLLS